MNKIIITSFTDPLCTWCWGEEPIFRKIETHFGASVQFRFVMGGLVEDFSSPGWPWNEPGKGGIPEGNKIIGRHWADASSKHGMPTVGEAMNLFDEKYRSSWPQNIAVKAAEIINPKIAPIFLHRLREASAAEGLQTSRDDVLISLAAQTGLDVQAFITAFTDGSARKAFENDKKYAVSLGVTGFPTCLVQYSDKTVLLSGYTNYDTFVAVFAQLSGGKIKPKTPATDDATILALLQKYGRLAPEEIRMAFDMPDVQTVHSRLEKLADEKKIHFMEMGNGYMVAISNPGCDNKNCTF